MHSSVGAVAQVLLINCVAYNEEMLHADAHQQERQPWMEVGIVKATEGQHTKATSKCKHDSNNSSKSHQTTTMYRWTRTQEKYAIEKDCSYCHSDI